jgi:acyl-CoA synthetase (NDP forming)
VRGTLATSRDDAVRAADAIGYPVALKIVSADVVHKTEVGGVRVGLNSALDVRAAYEEMVARVAQAAPRARVDGVLVQEVAVGGYETIVGMTRDSFGPLIMFGLGGVLVEALHDVVFRIAPLGSADAFAMMASIRGTKLLDGVRGAPPVDRDALASVICRISELAIDCPDVVELDVNPLLARASGALALDARVSISSRNSPTGASARQLP